MATSCSNRPVAWARRKKAPSPAPISRSRPPLIGDSSSFGGESGAWREPCLLRMPADCCPFAASNRSRGRSQKARSGALGSGWVPSCAREQGFCARRRCLPFPRACGGAGCLREGVARRPWRAGGMGMDGASQECAAFNAAAALQKPPVSRRFAAVASRESPPNGEESHINGSIVLC